MRFSIHSIFIEKQSVTFGNTSLMHTLRVSWFDWRFVDVLTLYKPISWKVLCHPFVILHSDMINDDFEQFAKIARGRTVSLE
jgi:hypothetical protein